MPESLIFADFYDYADFFGVLVYISLFKPFKGTVI